MKDLIINGRIIPSIWKTPDIANNTPSNTKHPKHPYADPTANAAMKNIMGKEKKKHRSK